MAEYILSSMAEADIKEIWYYTEERWGSDKATEYTERLEHRFGELAKSPKIGRLRDDIQRGYRSYLAEKHVIIYRERQKSIEIARVLHSRMDIKRHFLA